MPIFKVLIFNNVRKSFRQLTLRIVALFGKHCHKRLKNKEV